MNGDQVAQDTSDEVFDINDPIEKDFELWYGQQSVTITSAWYRTEHCFIAVNHTMSQSDREQLAQFILGQLQGESWGPYHAE